MVKQDPKQTIEYLLGQIASDVATIKNRQEVIDKKIDFSAEEIEKKIAELKKEVDEIREDRAYTKGKVVGVSGAVSVAISALGWIATKLF